MQNIPRMEHPFPQMERAAWKNLNGEWLFAFDFGESGKERRLYLEDALPEKITVPFCPESELSGIGYRDFIPAVWYKKKVSLTEAEISGLVHLHFGAVDYECQVYVNGQEAGGHRGGYASFTIDITAFVVAGENDITVFVKDDCRNPFQARGKQSEEFASHGCDYTRTTGIWQTVWLEFLPKAHICSVRYYPDIAAGRLHIHATTSAAGTFLAKALFQGKVCGEAKTACAAGNAELTIELSEVHLWEVGEGALYDLELSFEEDRVKSYFGLREVKFDGCRFLLNGRPLFQRLVLDQGFYPDGVYTAPDEEALLRDIKLSQALGFNGARLHQKVFEPRFLYHCDRLGYLVWGEYGSWGIEMSDLTPLRYMLPEWLEIVERDFNHPSIISWCPFNETWDVRGRKQEDDVLRIFYQVTKQLDPTRPCIDTSGNYHVVTDVFDLHNYEQDPEEFGSYYDSLPKDGTLRDNHASRQSYKGGLPVHISEYGGIKWAPDAKETAAWGYGDAPKTEEEFLQRYEGLTLALLRNPKICGFCYTQLYDVEQEVNGLYTYARKPKFPIERIRRINTEKAAIEE